MSEDFFLWNGDCPTLITSVFLIYDPVNLEKKSVLDTFLPECYIYIPVYMFLCFSLITLAMLMHSN